MAAYQLKRCNMLCYPPCTTLTIHYPFFFPEHVRWLTDSQFARCNMLSSLYYIDNSLSLFFPEHVRWLADSQFANEGYKHCTQLLYDLVFLPQLYTLDVTWSHITKPAHKLAIIFLIFMFCMEFQPNKTPTLVISDVPQRMKSSMFSFIHN